jgi:hypothetical protein
MSVITHITTRKILEITARELLICRGSAKKISSVSQIKMKIAAQLLTISRGILSSIEA